jgi:hypothetical protein
MPHAVQKWPNRLRRVAPAVAVTALALSLASTPAAVAAPPEQWVEADPVSPLSFLLVLLLIPAGLFVVISLLAALPDMMRRDTGYTPGLTWRHEPQWFGGPRDGLDKADQVDQKALEAAGERGGASGRW